MTKSAISCNIDRYGHLKASSHKLIASHIQLTDVTELKNLSVMYLL